MKLAMIDDKIIPPEELDPAWTDRGTYFGDGVYEVVRSYNGRLFALDEHLERLKHSLAETQIRGVSIESVREKVLRAFEEAQIADAKIYFHITRGLQRRDHLPAADLKAHFFLTVTQTPDFSIERRDGVKVCTHPDQRWKRCDIKSLNLLPNVLARMAAAEKGCFEAILVNEEGQITEGSSSAFFAVNVQAGELLTHPAGTAILSSITRANIIKIAPKAGLKVVEKAIVAGEAAKADELFVASTTEDIIGVVQFDGAAIGDGAPGAYTKALFEELQKHIHAAS
jgi:D-alanine transaminase